MAQQQYRNIFINLTPDEQVEEKKVCWFTKNKINYIDYKDADFLITWLNEQGMIIPRRITGTSAKHQRRLALAIKRARHIALLPFVSDSLK